MAKKSREKKKPVLLARLWEHFGCDPANLSILEQRYDTYDHPNLHLAIADLSERVEAAPKVIGVVPFQDYDSVRLVKLSRPQTAENFDEGPVEYIDISLPDQERLSCVKRGLYLLHVDDEPFALLVSTERCGPYVNLQIEIMGPNQRSAEKFARQLNQMVRHGHAYRGHVLSLELDCNRTLQMKFHDLPPVNREAVILPESLLHRIERHTLAFSEHANRLRAAGRHIKRGILLYGPPGTGKTYSAMYLASQMSGRTVFILTGGGMGFIETVCNIARHLEPATIILEDVDLIGTERNHQDVGANALLFELLNQMDGLADDADMLFILTTNRPDVLEPALAARPGRIDQAIEIPLPDEDCRRRLFNLYSVGLKLEVSRLDEFIRRMDGVSAAFIRELLRKAAVIAAIESADSLVVRDEHIDEALAELLVAGGPLTQSLLGRQRANA